MPQLSLAVDTALVRCGRDRVFHRHGPPAVAGRWSRTQVPPDEEWIVGEGPTHDDSGRAAATEFAKRIRAEASRLEHWADSIVASLDRKDGS